VQKALSALVHFEAREEVLLALERVQARTDYKTSLLKRIEASSKVLSASRGRGDVTPGQVEAPEKVLRTLKRVQARTDYKTSLLKRIEASSKVLSASRGRGDVTPGQVEAPERVLLTLE